MFHKAGLVWLLASSIFTPLLAAPAPETAVNPRSVGAPEVYDELSAPVIEAREVEKRASPFQGLKRYVCPHALTPPSLHLLFYMHIYMQHTAAKLN